MEDSDRIEELFNDALDRPVNERMRFLAAECGEDANLRENLISLLRTYDNEDNLLEVPAPRVSVTEIAGGILESEEASAVGKLVGAYKIEKEIGHGGMGSVFLATRNDQMFEKRVAIKLLRRGNENNSIVKRFEKERQILANLEHPNIAHLLDGGITENGLPYFVMEYVDGTRINRFCDERGLSVRKRLELFREVCAAVEFAHKRSIIHRDIKPGNILVTKEGMPKLLDFGIAKSLSIDETATALPFLTPEYASPEQMRGGKVGIGSDIYSLGVVLYQLLTGGPPYQFESKSPYEMVQAICEEDPPRPSSRLTGRMRETTAPTFRLRDRVSDRDRTDPRLLEDIDIIVLKALNKEPQDRYASVRDLSDDIRLALAGMPITSRRRAGFAYRASRFVKRHKAASLSALSALAAFCLVIASIVFFNIPAASTAEQLAPSSSSVASLPAGRFGGDTDSLEAYNLYLRAYHLWAQRTGETNLQATQLFLQAVEADPDYARAYSGLANTYILSSVWTPETLPPAEGFIKARRAAEKAIALRPEMAEGHLSFAMIFWLYEWDWQSADREFRTAVDLDPNYTLAQHWFGLFLGEMGRFDEAIAAEKRALEIEPLSVPINADLARVLFYARRYDEASQQYERTLKLNPNFRGCFPELLELYEAMRSNKEWHQLLRKIGPIQPALEQAYRTQGILGYRRKALEISPSAFNAWNYYFSPAHAPLSVDNMDEAFVLLNEALRTRDPRIVQIKVSPKYDHLRKDPRFVALMTQMNF